MKRLLLALFLTAVMVSSVNAQSTLALQEKCAEGAKKYVSEAYAKFEIAYSYHYNKKLDKCFVKIIHFVFGSPNWVEVVNVFENIGIGLYSPPPKPFCNVEGIECGSPDEFEILIKPYMED
jgi:hypothetical protein